LRDATEIIVNPGRISKTVSFPLVSLGIHSIKRYRRVLLGILPYHGAP